MDAASTDIDRLAAAVAERLLSGPGSGDPSPPSIEEQALERLTYHVMCRVAERTRPVWLVEDNKVGGAEHRSASPSENDAGLVRMAERLLGDPSDFPKIPIEIERIEI